MSDQIPSQKALPQLRAIALDVDGVLTDSGLWLGPDDGEWKRFSFADIMGLSLARRAGLELALISGEDSPIVDRFAKRTSIRHVVKGCKDKASALRSFSDTTNILLAHIGFVGDDVNDLSAMQIAGWSAVPSNAASDVLRHVRFVSKNPGGQGAVREIIEEVLAAQDMSAYDVYSTCTRRRSRQTMSKRDERPIYEAL
jgi:3-deoxy-D-manno-octulosonate 8-phosphate phosphatase (KDO 8-P phosphatase)